MRPVINTQQEAFHPAFRGSATPINNKWDDAATTLQKIPVQQQLRRRCRHCHCYIRPANCLTRAAAILNANRPPDASSSSNTHHGLLARPTSSLSVAILNADCLRGVSLSIVNDLHRTVQRYNYSVAKWWKMKKKAQFIQIVFYLYNSMFWRWLYWWRPAWHASCSHTIFTSRI